MWPNFIFADPPISLERLKVQTPNFACGLTTRDTKPKDEKLVKSGRGPGHNLLFKFWDPLISLEWLQIQTSNFACVLRVRHTKPKKIKSWCWKWPAVPFPRYLLTRCVTQLLVGVWPSYLSLRIAGSLTAQTLNLLDNTCHCLSRYTRAWTGFGGMQLLIDNG